MLFDSRNVQQRISLCCCGFRVQRHGSPCHSKKMGFFPTIGLSVHVPERSALELVQTWCGEPLVSMCFRFLQANCYSTSTSWQQANKLERTWGLLPPSFLPSPLANMGNICDCDFDVDVAAAGLVILDSSPQPPLRSCETGYVMNTVLGFASAPPFLDTPL
jgi:hypothetical protein